MSELKYNVGDKVLIKSIDWYNANKDEFDIVSCKGGAFVNSMTLYCDSILTIIDKTDNCYWVKENAFSWTDEMIEGLVEEETKNNNDMEEKETLLGWVKENDSLRLVPHKDYEIKHDGDNFYLVKKKKEYPKTYAECCKVLGVSEFEYNHTGTKMWYRHKLMATLDKLMLCRNAYWKIAGEEMGLGKPWKPDWTIPEQVKYAIYYYRGGIKKDYWHCHGHILAFPTEGIRDEFYENFKIDIERCKELL